MKKILLLTTLLVCTIFSFAQVSQKEKEIAKQLINSNLNSIGLSKIQSDDAIVEGTYVISGTDIRVVYLQQGYKGIPVYNQLLTLAFKNGKTVSNMGARFFSDMAYVTNNSSGKPVISPVDAIQTVLNDLRIKAAEAAVPVATLNNGNKFEFGKLGVADENITVELVWVPMGEKKEARLAWQVLIAPSGIVDSWLTRIDAVTGAILGKTNMTISCNFDGDKHTVKTHIEKNHVPKKAANYLVYRQPEQQNKWKYAPIVSGAGYRVVALPAESPIHAGGTPSVVNNPWLASPGNATSLGWHYDGSTYHDSTRGNNVWAYLDRLNADDGGGAPNTGVAGRATVSSTPQPTLTFNDAYDFTKSPIDVTSPNQQAAVTNLFYLNNMIHDLAYLYGFDENGRNFQNDNQGRGGLGTDYVAAQAQDGGGTNNANMRTFPDGTRPRMQMYIWNQTTPNRDGDLDNGIIAHEYTHGISNRLTGNGSSCLTSAEQMGEGWSDYYGLMMTQDWATSTINSGFSSPRGIGTYALGQPITGVGIRQFPYTTNMAINPMTYANLPTVVAPHGVGTIWCTALWDMTWEIIQTAGINSNIYNPAGGGGNAIALKLVTEGMRLQPCNPGFIDGRNAILKADTLFFGSQYSCAIIRAFARRGMGVNASQGSAGSRTDQVVDFNDGGTRLTLTQDAPNVNELQNITYTRTVEALCSNLTNYRLVDTLPTSVTYVSGGVYNAGNRTVTFAPVNVIVGTPQIFVYTVNVNAGTYFAPNDHINDPVPGPGIPAMWTSTSNTANVWTVSSTQSNSAPNSYFTPNAAIASHQVLRTTNNITLPALSSSRSVFSFWHRYNTEPGWDGGVIEISTNGGVTWTDLGPRIIEGNYDGVLGNAVTNQLANRLAFNGSVAAFKKTEVDLASYRGQNIQIRFRFGSDDNTAPVGGGWWIDDILIRSEAVISARSNLFNATNVRVAYEDTISYILPAACTAPSITQQPASSVSCSSATTANFSVLAVGTAVTCQWEVSTNGGLNWTAIAGATATSYSIANPTTATNGNLYRAVATGGCGTATSNAAILYVSPALTHSGQTATPAATCAPGASAITATAAGGTVNNTAIGSTGAVTIAIPDGTGNASSTIRLPAMTIQQAANLKLRVNIAHTFVGDLTLTLTSPCGTTFLFDRPGIPADPFGNGDNLGTNNSSTPGAAVYTFDINAAAIISETPNGAGVIDASVAYQPSNNANPGVAHNWTGLTFPCSAEGDWTLTLVDAESTDIGTLSGWEIVLGGNYTHTMTGPGTITQNAATGANNSTANFSVSALPAGAHNFVLTSTDLLGCSVSSTIAVNVTNNLAITTQPVDRVICAGQNTTFNVATDAVLTPTYQWQLDQGAGFIDLAEVAPFSGTNTATLTVSGPSTTYNGNSFRVIITNGCGITTSAARTLTVNPLPTLNVGPSGQCAPVVLTATGNSDTYAWAPATGLSATTGATVTASPTSTTAYTVTGTITATGCQNSATVIVNGTPATPVVTPASPTVCAGAITALNVAPTTVTFSSTVPLAIPAGAPGNTNAGPADPYPATINVAGMPITGATVKSVTINGITHNFPDDLDILLQSPTGTNVVLLSDVGGANSLSNINYTLDDAAAALLTDGGINPSGTYRPSNFGAADTWTAPGPGAITQATPTLSSFTGDANGQWKLFVVDDANLDIGSITSWSITFNVPTARWSPVTDLYTDAAGTIPYVAGTFASTVYHKAPVVAAPTATTYTVTNTLGACAAAAPATVTVTVNPAPTVAVSPNNQCSPVTLTATGTATTFTWAPAAGLSATTGATVVANPSVNTVYTVTGTLASSGCTATASVTVNATPAAPVVTPTSVSICLGAITALTANSFNSTFTSAQLITVPAGAPANTAAGIASPYPATISVSGLPASGVRVKSIQLNGVTHTFPDDVDVLVQSPTATNVIVMSDAGGSNPYNNNNFVFDDAAAALMSDGGVNASGTYRPSNFGATDPFVAPGPGSITQATPALSTFTGNMNGNWNLYVVDDLGGDVGSISNWSITFEVNGAVWTPVTNLFTNPGATIPYVAGTIAATVYAKPTTTTTYSATRASATCTSPATNATVTVLQPVAITTNPANISGCVGGRVVFRTVATGNALTYQWQVNTGSGFTNIAGAVLDSLVLTNLTLAQNTFQYRVIVTNGCGTATSTAGVLTVNATPALTITPLGRICISDTTIRLVGSPVGGSWSGIGVSGNNFVPTATAIGTYNLTYSYTSPAGCSNTTSTVAKVESCPERLILLRDNAVVLFPNPNNGRFNIRINSALYNYLGMRVHTADGRLVRTQLFNGLVFGRVIPIDLTVLPAGVYMVNFFYDDGARSSDKTFKVIVGR